MQEAPHAAILNRDEAIEVAQRHFSRQLALLQDLANYGSNLVIRAYDSSPKKMTEVVVCGVLLKQVVAMVDAFEVLLSSGCSHAAYLPARAAFEASIYADWILAGNSELKANRYMVANYRDECTWTSMAISGTAEEAVFTSIAKSIGVDIHANRPTLGAEATARLAEINRILSQPELAPIDLAYTAARGKRKVDPEWYELDGLKSIRQVADAVGRLAEYEFFYSKGSQVTHTGSYKDHVRFAGGEVRFKPIRHLQSINLLLSFVVAIVLGTYQKILTRYRPGELPAYGRKYLNDWRDPFQNVTSVKYAF